MNQSLISEFSPTEHELLSAFVSHSASQGWSQQRRTIELLLYLTGEKPATEFTQVHPATVLTDTPSMPKEGFARLVEAFNLPHERVAKQLTDELVGIYYECLPHPDTPLPPQTEDEPEFHRQWGTHYGYPQSAISAYIHGECLRYATDKTDWNQLRTLAQQEYITDKELARLPLVSFLPPNTPDGLHEAVELAHDYERGLYELADTHHLPQIREIVSAVIRNQPRPE